MSVVRKTPLAILLVILAGCGSGHYSGSTSDPVAAGAVGLACEYSPDACSTLSGVPVTYGDVARDFAVTIYDSHNHPVQIVISRELESDLGGAITLVHETSEIRRGFPGHDCGDFEAQSWRDQFDFLGWFERTHQRPRLTGRDATLRNETALSVQFDRVIYGFPCLSGVPR